MIFKIFDPDNKKKPIASHIMIRQCFNSFFLITVISVMRWIKVRRKLIYYVGSFIFTVSDAFLGGIELKQKEASA